ncbi:1,2-phenylacetyl-CoA epoxidase subunit PaaD [Aliikangiella sp. IMCC44632]
MNQTAQIIPTHNPVFAQRLALRRKSEHADIWNLLDQVYDPELPGLTIWDLGILQNVEQESDYWVITITPTYSGCPAVDAIKDDVVKALSAAGIDKVKVKVALAPAWTTEMMSPQGKAHLKSIQIAPPNEQNNVVCPLCESDDTLLVSQFGSTACKAMYQCKSCSEIFDYFKHF